MGFIIAAIVVVCGSIGSASKTGLFKKGADSTRRNTYAFERGALEMKLARIESKQRTVVELNGADAKSVQLTSQYNAKAEQLKDKITLLKQAEDQMTVPRTL